MGTQAAFSGKGKGIPLENFYRSWRKRGHQWLFSCCSKCNSQQRDNDLNREVCVPAGHLKLPLLPLGSHREQFWALYYIVDVCKPAHSEVQLFADDTLLYRILANDANCDQLQEYLHKLEEWHHQWQVEFIPSKCKILYISTKQNPPKSMYTFFVTEFDQVGSISYLRVTVNSKLKWFQHIASISTNATKTLGLIRRNLWNCPKNVKESSYCSIVGPKLEYVSASWDPPYKKDVYTLQRVQRKAAHRAEWVDIINYSWPSKRQIQMHERFE